MPDPTERPATEKRSGRFFDTRHWLWRDRYWLTAQPGWNGMDRDPDLTASVTRKSEQTPNPDIQRLIEFYANGSKTYLEARAQHLRQSIAMHERLIEGLLKNPPLPRWKYRLASIEPWLIRLAWALGLLNVVGWTAWGVG